MSKRSIPYAQAQAGPRAREQITKLLRGFGCASVGFMDDFENQSMLLAFRYRGRQFQLEASAKGWAAIYLEENPWHSGRSTSKEEYEAKVLKQGMLAANSIIRDWIKGQLAAAESRIVKFEHIFMPFMLTRDGRTLAELVDGGGVPLLGPPDNNE